MKGFIFGLLAAAISLTSAAQARADWMYVGSYAVGDGPMWTSNPPVYSAREAAALLFGGVYADYAISTNSSQDPSTINFQAHVDGWADAQYLVASVPEDFKKGTFYNQDFGVIGSTYSAYVHDHDWDFKSYPDGQGLVLNYVWKEVAATPEPLSGILLGLGGLGLAGYAWRRRRLGWLQESF